jgi:hypothetical protein
MVNRLHCLLLSCFMIIAAGGSFSFRKANTLSTPSCQSIINQTIVAIDNIRTIRYHLVINERIKGVMKRGESLGKLNRNPRKIYLNLKGPELLWVAGTNGGNALVNPNGFPYIDLNLDPMGSLLRENQHHTLHEVGFDYYAGVLRYSLKFAGTKFDTYFKLLPDVTWNGRACYSVKAEYPEFKYVDYTVKKGEDLIKISRALFVSEYMVREANADKVSDYYNVHEGQVIKVPIVYGKKTEMLIDKELMLPISIKVSDDKGLFELYEYDKIEVNVPIADEEFTKSYKDYHF